MTLFLWARPMRPRNHSPIGLWLAESDGKAARAPWIRSVRRYRRLTGHEAQPGSEIARPAEGLARADRRDERRRVESAEARDGGEPPRGLVLPGSRHELGRERRDALVELGPFQAHILDEETDAVAQSCGPIAVEQSDQILLKPSSSLRNHDAALEEHGTELVDQRRALADQARPGPVQDLRVELRLALQLDEAHGGPGRGFGDRLGIALVVLLGFDVGLHVLGRHQPHLVTLLAQDTAEVVGSAAGFHCHYAGRQRSGKTDDALPSEASPQDDATRSVQSCDAAAVLAKIYPKHRNRHRPLLSLRVSPAA